MPKKTKKEKIIAQYRRQLELLKKQASSFEPQPKIISQPSSVNKKNTEETIKNSSEQIKYYFLADFKKSIFLTFFIIALELFLYFAMFFKFRF
jgi:hypothetical protein